MLLDDGNKIRVPQGSFKILLWICFSWQVRSDVLNLHMEMIKQFQKQELLMQHYSINQELLEEIQRLREENKQLCEENIKSNFW